MERWPANIAGAAPSRESTNPVPQAIPHTPPPWTAGGSLVRPLRTGPTRLSKERALCACVCMCSGTSTESTGTRCPAKVTRKCICSSVRFGCCVSCWAMNRPSRALSGKVTCWRSLAVGICCVCTPRFIFREGVGQLQTLDRKRNGQLLWIRPAAREQALRGSGFEPENLGISGERPFRNDVGPATPSGQFSEAPHAEF